MPLTANDLIRRFDTLTRKRFPEWDGGHLGTQVIINGDDWTGKMVVKADDVTHLLGWIVGRLKGRPC